MPNDFQKKQPTKNEQMFYQLMMNQDMLDRRLWTTSSFVSALCVILEIDPKKVAELLTTGQEKLKVYSQEINTEIDRIEKEQKPNGTENGSQHVGDDHEGHDHTGHNHGPALREELEQSEGLADTAE